MAADPKPEPRVKNPLLLRALHQRWRECALCGKTRPLSLHHIHKHPRDDVEGNLVMLCGDGVRGCHGMIEAGNRGARAALGAYLVNERDDVLPYLTIKLGNETSATHWLRRNLFAPI